MKKTVKSLFAGALILLCSFVSNALPLVWRADWPDAKPVETLVHRGTDIELQPLWRINKEIADTNGWTFTTFCQTNAVGPWFGPLPGAFFSHTNDVGASFYNVMVRAETPDGAVNYTAFARLRMLDSPGFAPGELPLPAKSIDFAEVEVFNAPWTLQTDFSAATNTLSSAIASLAQNLATNDYDGLSNKPQINGVSLSGNKTGADLGLLDLSGGTVTGDIIMPNGLLDAGDVITRSYYDFLTPDQGARYLAAPENSGKALTDADISDSTSALGAAIAGKADNSDVVHKTGDETIEGVKTFNDGIVSHYDIDNANGFVTTMGVILYDVARGSIGGDDSDDHLIHIRTYADTDLGLPLGDVTIPRAKGMVALTSDIDAAISPTAPVASATLAWQSNGSAIVVSVAAGGTLSATFTDWIEGQTQTALINLAAGASVSPEVKLVGYGTWPTGGQFLASATRIGNNVYVTPIVLVN